MGTLEQRTGASPETGTRKTVRHEGTEMSSFRTANLSN